MLNGARKKHGTEVTKIGQNNHSLTLAAHAQAGYGRQFVCQSVRVCAPFSNARGNSKVRMRCQYIGNEVIN